MAESPVATRIGPCQPLTLVERSVTFAGFSAFDGSAKRTRFSGILRCCFVRVGTTLQVQALSDVLEVSETIDNFG